MVWKGSSSKLGLPFLEQSFWITAFPCSFFFPSLLFPVKKSIRIWQKATTKKDQRKRKNQGEKKKTSRLWKKDRTAIPKNKHKLSNRKSGAMRRKGRVRDIGRTVWKRRTRRKGSKNWIVRYHHSLFAFLLAPTPQLLHYFSMDWDSWFSGMWKL